MILIFVIINLTLGYVNFVSVGDDSTSGNFYSIAYSENGITWTSNTQSIFTAGFDVAYGLMNPNNPKWVAVGQGSNTIAFSNDGISWSGLSNTIFTTAGKGIAFSSSQQTWVGCGSGTNSLAVSPDGETWTPLGLTIFATECSDVVFGNTNWVAVGVGGGNTAAYSPDGTNWTPLGVIVGARYGVAFSVVANQYLSCGTSTSGNNAATSPDGVTWTGFRVNIGNVLQEAAYGQGKWIVAGQPNDGVSPFPFANSSDAVTWEVTTTDSILVDSFGITYNSAFNRWVAVGSIFSPPNSNIYSADGKNWLAATNVFSTGGWGIATNDLNLNDNGPMDPPILIVDDVVNLNINGSSLIPSNTSITIIGNLTVDIDLTINGTCNFGLNSTVQIGNNLNINNITSFLFDFGGNDTYQNKSITTVNLIININVNFNVYLMNFNASGNFKRKRAIASAATLSLGLVEYQNVSGSFDTPIVYTCGDSLDNCEVSTCISAQPNYGESTLSVSMDLTGCSGSGVLQNEEGVSIYLIIGVAAGGSLIAIVVMTLIVMKMRKIRMERAALLSAKLRQQHTEAVCGRQILVP